MKRVLTISLSVVLLFCFVAQVEALAASRWVMFGAPLSGQNPWISGYAIRNRLDEEVDVKWEIREDDGDVSIYTLTVAAYGMQIDYQVNIMSSWTGDVDGDTHILYLFWTEVGVDNIQTASEIEVFGFTCDGGFYQGLNSRATVISDSDATKDQTFELNYLPTDQIPPWWTGVAFMVVTSAYGPGSDAGSVVLDAYNPDGTYVGSCTKSLTGPITIFQIDGSFGSELSGGDGTMGDSISIRGTYSPPEGEYSGRFLAFSITGNNTIAFSQLHMTCNGR